ncbi:UDP-glucose 6-dehydrogenase [Paenibacillus swuensis]|uniref:UDP-glucose 6-dehydrogenase n=1 Tax=Paenibacillus swuensis TaxID=1178515 RepID=A0A172TGS3_9BACL|nr:UDP-glucose/GDP-mannose dehydrogenase family protein [Paenibacillus swuensis]ANE46248.1 UDP-glucose 6-dehydrogenase [Paenibacillus swuensis]
MNIAVIGTGYVGLVTGVCLSELGHRVICIDQNPDKISILRDGISPIYEPGLEPLMIDNMDAGRLDFTTSMEEGLSSAEIIYITVGTPPREDGSADLSHISQVADEIAAHLQKEAVIVIKSTVPVGTNEYVKNRIEGMLANPVRIRMVSNPEFLREGSAVQDTFHGDRIIIGTEDEESASIMEKLYSHLQIPVYTTDIRSSEMIKYASNAFLATKISFMNEISNVCEKLGADVESVAIGMGLDKRIGNQFLKAGIGYGGSCFPKDTKALMQIAGNVHYDFKLLKSVIEVNADQQTILIGKALERFGTVRGKRIALLGLAFKPNTDDMREAPSIAIARHLINLGAEVIGYDPVANGHAEHVLPVQVRYAETLQEALWQADVGFILTEWAEICALDLHQVSLWMREAVLFDGRNCFSLGQAAAAGVEYHSIGRKSVAKERLFV